MLVPDLDSTCFTPLKCSPLRLQARPGSGLRRRAASGGLIWGQVGVGFIALIGFGLLGLTNFDLVKFDLVKLGL